MNCPPVSVWSACHIPLGGTGPVPRLLLRAASCFQLLAQTRDCIIAIARSTRRRSSPAPLGKSRSVGRLHSLKEGVVVLSASPQIVLMSSALHALPRQSARHAPSVAQEVGKRAARGAIVLTGRARHARLCRV